MSFTVGKSIRMQLDCSMTSNGTFTYCDFFRHDEVLKLTYHQRAKMQGFRGITLRFEIVEVSRHYYFGASEDILQLSLFVIRYILVDKSHLQ